MLLAHMAHPTTAEEDLALLKGLLIEHVAEDIRAVRIPVRRSVDRANAAYFFTILETRTCDFFFHGSVLLA